MKKLGLFLIMAVLILTACDGNQGKVKQFAEDFVDNLKRDNMEWIASVYPDADFKDMKIQGPVDIKVEPTDEKDVYKANLSEDTWIIVSCEGKDDFKVINSHGLAVFPETKLKLAKVTGMVDSDTNDLEAAERMNDEQFYGWFYKNKLKLIELDASPVKFTPIMYSEGGYSSTNCKVTNISSSRITGDQYEITYVSEYVNCSDGSIPNSYVKETKAGVTLDPGESKTITIKNTSVGITGISLKLKMPEEEMLSLFKPTGREYKEFIAIYGEPSTRKSEAKSAVECLAQWPAGMPEGGNITQFAWLSDYELTPTDLKHFSKAQLRILRNAIYAMHGYIFASEDLRDYFSKFTGYDPVSKVIPDFNKVEQTNINLIKRYE